MIYLDYCATTPVNEEVLETFIKVTKEYIGNPNSLHRLGHDTKKIIDASTKQIADLLKVRESEVIYTSGATEANNLAIKGVALKYQNRGKHILTSPLEHSSVLVPLLYLESKYNYEIEYLSLDDDGRIDLEDLKNKLRKDTVLVSVSSLNSEVGIVQPIQEIANIVKQNKITKLHSDMTQHIGKENIDLSNIDLVTFAPQKFFGMKGIGVLIKKENIELEPLIHGGKSTTEFRSGTPAGPLIASTAKALRIALTDIDKKHQYVEELNQYLRDNLKIDGIHINSNEWATPYILNLSIGHIRPETMLHALEEENIYISTQTACSKGGRSESVYAVTKNEKYAKHSIRISLSYLTTKEELDRFLEVFRQKYEKLNTLYVN